jgi:AsmA protein
MARHARRLILWTIGSLLALALLAALGVVVFVYSVDPNVFRGRIEKAASDALGRPVRLSGDLRWRLGAHIGIESRGGEIGNAAGFDGPFASWRALRLDVAARPLLNRELEVGRVAIDGLALHLQRNAAGQGNWTLQTAPDAGQSSQMKFRVDALELRDASVQFSDAASGRQWKLAALDFKTDLPADLKAATLEFADVSLRARANGPPLPADGVTLALTVPAVSVTVGEPSISVPEWKLRWDEAQIDGSVQARGGAATQAQGQISVRAASLRRLLNTIAVALPATRDPKAFGNFSLAARWNYRDAAADAGASAALESVDLTLDDTQLQGSVTLPRLSPLSLRFDLTADKVDADRYLDDTSTEPFELPLAALKALDAKGTLRIREARVAGAAAKELTVDVE